MAAVIDTNVPVIASTRISSSRRGPTVEAACIQACIQQIQAMKRGEILCLDDGWRILGEYQTQLARLSSQSVGAQFLRWLLQRRTNRRFCELVPITQLGEDGYDFEEFPAREDLASFDRSDRKFVAVALASRLDPTIVYAADRGWPRHADALAASGVKLRALCDVRDKSSE